MADFGESRFLLNPWEENMTKQPGEKSINICNLIIIQTGTGILLPKLFYPTVRDIHIECSKQFKCNLYFYGSGQSRPFWAELKLL